jgi:membrane associated rhomboid family serine protease
MRPVSIFISEYLCKMDKELKNMLYSFIPAGFIVMMMWLVKYMEYSSGYDFGEFGVYPRHLSGLKGIICSPFIHADLEHLTSNSIPFLLLGAGMVYFYKELALRVFLLIYFLSGIGLWLGGREVYHIGASGVVYGMAFFLFVSGILRRDTRLMAISLLVVFLYGSMVWGVFPLWRGISWEAHLFGSLAGILCAVAYRHEGPQRQAYIWETEPEEDEKAEENNPESAEAAKADPGKENEIKVNYIYKENNPTNHEPGKD